MHGLAEAPPVLQVAVAPQARLPQVKPQGCLHRSWKSLSSWRKGTLDGTWILTLMVETSFHCSLSQESGLITARTIPVLTSNPWSCLLLGMCSLNTTFISGGTGGVLGVGGLFSPFNAFENQGWNPLLPPFIEIGQIYWFGHGFTHVFHTTQNCMG